MEKKNIIHWCQRAAKDIRYKPDREAVTLELYHHAEDHYDTLIEKGLSPADAEAKVLEAMGSAEEIAPQLAAVHKPWLGYLHSLIRFVAICAVALALFYWGSNGVSLINSLIREKQFDALPANFGTLDYYSNPYVTDSSDGFLFQVSEAGFREDQAEFYCQLDMLYWPYLRRSDVMRHIWAIDSNGNRYASSAEANYRDIPRVARGAWSRSAVNSTHYLTIMHFDCSAEWVELHYDRDGRDVVLRIDLTGGEHA